MSPSSKYLELYRTRYSYDSSVQAMFAQDYDEIDKDLKKYFSNTECHPYEIRPVEGFTDNLCYLEGNDNWFSAEFTNGETYLYRIDNLYKLFSWNKKNIVNERMLKLKYSINKINAGLLDMNEIPNLYLRVNASTNDWISLSELMIKYETSRDLTWWTNASFEGIDNDEYFIDMAHQVGLATNWINNYSVILRCNLDYFEKTSEIKMPKVPSVIDAYNSPIFKAQDEKKIPKYGIAINLKNIYENGFHEYVIRKIPIEFIDLRMIKISDYCLKCFEYGKESEDLYNKIIALYTT